MDAATTDDVRFAYIDRKDFLNFVHKHDAQTDAEIGAEFDAWMEAHDREVRAQAYEALAADPHHGWAIATSLIDMAAVERGEMTQAEMDEKWGVER